MEEGSDVRADFALAEASKKRPRRDADAEAPPKSAKSAKKNRQDDVIKAIGSTPVTERHILQQVGDNRYTREILRRLMSLEVVQRLGKGGANDPFLYKFVRTPEEALELGMVDPTVDIRMQRIETKIVALLGEQDGFVTEKQIRAAVGDNTGTGKALRRLVVKARVERAGRGGAGNPFTYKLNRAAVEDGVLLRDASEALDAAVAVDGAGARLGGGAAMACVQAADLLDDDDDSAIQDLSECSTLASSKATSHAGSDSEEDETLEGGDGAALDDVTDECNNECNNECNEAHGLPAQHSADIIAHMDVDALGAADDMLLEPSSFAAAAPPPARAPPPPTTTTARAAGVADDFLTSLFA